MSNDEEQPKSRKSDLRILIPTLNNLQSTRKLALNNSVLDYKNIVPSQSSVPLTISCDENKVNSFLSSIAVPINDSNILTDYDLKEEDWQALLAELKSSSEPVRDIIKHDTTRKYGGKERNALMSILVCHPPLEVVKLIVELGGNDTVVKVGGCGFNAIHYACWGNTSLEVIKYLLDIGGKKALLQESKNGGANPLHIACTRYKTTESNSLCDVIRLLIEVGGHDVVTATDFNDEIPLQGLLLRPEMPVVSVITFFDKWYEIEKTGGTVLPDKRRKLLIKPSENRTNDSTNDENTPDGFTDDDDKSTLISDDKVNALSKKFERNEAFNKAFNKLTGQLLKVDYDARSQILKTNFMKKYLTEKFIEPLPLAILITDLYIQGLIVCVFSFFINNTSPNPVDSATTVIILGICVSWRLFRELMQLMTTSLGTYISDIFNWFDVMQIVLIVSTMCMDIDDHSSSEHPWMLPLATFYSWVELLFVLHAFNYDLAVFVVATIKIMQRLSNFIFTTAIFVASFAHMYYIAGTNTKDEEFCNNPTNLTDADFNSIGGFTCTRGRSYMYSVTNIFTFESPTGVPRVIPLLYAFVMVILFLNLVIAVICTAFEEVLNESEMSFWSDRLIIVNELGGFLSRIPRYLLTSFPTLIECRFLRRYQRLLGHQISTRSERAPRIDLNLLLDPSDWDNVNDEDIHFLHWWYGKKKEGSPALIVRLKFFITKSRLKDIFLPGHVFENVILGSNRSHRSSKCEKLTALPFSIFLLVVCNTALLAVYILGWISFGLLWPKNLKRKLFSANNEKKKIIPEIKRKNEEISEMMDENKKMRVEIQCMKENIEEILSEIKSNHSNKGISQAVSHAPHTK